MRGVSDERARLAQERLTVTIKHRKTTPHVDSGDPRGAAVIGGLAALEVEGFTD
jgi:hypothetical protein